MTLSSKDLTDPFNAGQMLGIITTLMFLEKEKHIPEDMLQKIKHQSAKNLEEYLQKPSEDILLMVNDIIKDKKTL